MAIKRTSPPTTPRTLTLVQGRVISESLDGISGDGNPGGIPAPQGATEEQGSPTNLRGERGSGTPATESSSLESLGGVGRLLPPDADDTKNPFTSGNDVLKTIAQRFNLARVDGKVGAWRQFQRDLMDASPFIVPVIIPYKDLISIVSDIEKEIKGSNAIAGKSNEELLASFLKGENELGVDMTAPAPEGIDNSATIPSSGSSS